MIRRELVCSTWYDFRHSKLCRKKLALICILIQEAYVKKFFAKRAFLHILNVYSHTKLNTPVLVWSLKLSNSGLNHVTKHFSVTIDCVRFLIRRFPRYAYLWIEHKGRSRVVGKVLSIMVRFICVRFLILEIKKH